MALKKCPSCGAAFNGRKCGNCLYVPFTEEIAHGLHTHEGEPLIIEAYAEKPRRKPARCERRIWKIPKWVKTAVAWILVINLLPLGIEWIQDGIDQARVPEPAPEPVLSPLASKLWEGEDITIWVDKATNPMEIPILVENNSREEIGVSAERIQLGDFQTTYTHLYVNAGKESWGRGYLYLDEEDLNFSGPGPFTEVAFDLEIYDSDSYDTLYEIEGVRIPLEQGVYGKPAPDGLLLLDNGEAVIRYLGFERDDSHWKFFFLAENRTENRLHIWLENASLDGTAADISLWEEIQPGATAVTYAYFYPEEHLDPENLELTLHISDENYEVVDMSQGFTIPLK